MKKIVFLIVALALAICMCTVNIVLAAGSGATFDPGDIEIDIGTATGSRNNPLVVTGDTVFRVSAGDTYYIAVQGNDGKTLEISGIKGFTVNKVDDTKGVYTDTVEGDEAVYAITNKTGARQKYTVTLKSAYTVSFVTPMGVPQIQDMPGRAEGITLPAAEAPAGYTFAGWVDQAVEDTHIAPQTYKAGSSYAAAEDVTLIALYSYGIDGVNVTYYTTENFCPHQWDAGVVSGENTTYTCADCGSEKVIKKLPGDCNGDMQINNEDVIYLLWHTMFPGDYPLEMDVDFTKDGAVNNEDVIYLLWHTMFPDGYPLV